MRTVTVLFNTKRKYRVGFLSQSVSIKLTELGDGFSYFPRISNFLLYDLTITINIRNTVSLFVKFPSNFECQIIMTDNKFKDNVYKYLKEFLGLEYKENIMIVNQRQLMTGKLK